MQIQSCLFHLPLQRVDAFRGPDLAGRNVVERADDVADSGYLSDMGKRDRVVIGTEPAK
jgi:hypothetical protein